MSTTAEPQAKRAELLRSAAYFPVGDVTAAGAHYRDILGFTCEYTGGEPPEFALYSRGACSIMLRLTPRSCADGGRGPTPRLPDGRVRGRAGTVSPGA